MKNDAKNFNEKKGSLVEGNYFRVCPITCCENGKFVEKPLTEGLGIEYRDMQTNSYVVVAFVKQQEGEYTLEDVCFRTVDIFDMPSPADLYEAFCEYKNCILFAKSVLEDLSA